MMGFFKKKVGKIAVATLALVATAVTAVSINRTQFLATDKDPVVQGNVSVDRTVTYNDQEHAYTVTLTATGLEPVKEVTTSAVVFVIDCSGSMNKTPTNSTRNFIEMAKDAVREAVDTLLIDENTEVAFVAYGSQVCANSVNDEKSNHGFYNASIIEDAKNFISTVKVPSDSYTNIQAGLIAADALLEQSDATKKSVILMSDGAPNACYKISRIDTSKDEYYSKKDAVYTLKADQFEAIQEMSSTILRGNYNYEIVKEIKNGIEITYKNTSPKPAILWQAKKLQAKNVIIHTIFYNTATANQGTDARFLSSLASNENCAHAATADQESITEMYQSVAGNTQTFANDAVVTDLVSNVKPDNGVAYDIIDKSGDYTWNFEDDETITWSIVGLEKDVTAKFTYKLREKNYKVSYVIPSEYRANNTVGLVEAYYYANDTVKMKDPTNFDQNRYVFTGWKLANGTEPTIENKQFSMPQSNLQFIAQFTDRLYEVKFDPNNGDNLITKSDYLYGARVEVPNTPQKASENTADYNYKFVGWFDENGTLVEEFPAVTKNTTYVAKYEKEYVNYTITFVDYDESEIVKKTDYHYGQTVAIPKNPIRPADATYTYEFAGWNKIVDTTVKGNETYTATYKATPINYTITFVDYDESEIAKKTDYHYGQAVAIPENPSRQADETYTYEFAGWNKVVNPTVAGSETYTATYKATPINYTIKFVDYDNRVISEKKDYHYGDAVVVPQDPSRTSDVVNTYEFIGWDETVEKTVKGNATYTAMYKATGIEYVVIFADEDGTQISKKVYGYGANTIVPEAPKKAADQKFTYEFAGWVEEVSETVTKDVTYKATYKAIPIDYTVEFVDYDGTVLSTEKYNYGATVIIPADPTRAADEKNTYAFAGWNSEVTVVTGNATYKATYTATEIPTKSAEVEGDVETTPAATEIVAETKAPAEETKAPAETVAPTKAAEVEADTDVTTADFTNYGLLISLIVASAIALAVIVMKKRSSNKEA